MTVWDDVLQAIDNFFNWLTSLGGNVAEPLFQLGSWIAQGLSSFGAWFYSGLEWIYKGLESLGSKFVEGLTWIWQGLNSLAGLLGAGITWVGQGLQNIGQWIYSGLLWVGRTALAALQNMWNWILEQFVTIWNWIVDLVSGFVDSLNAWWTDFVGGLRDKFKELIIVNLTIPAVWKATERLIENPSYKTLLGWIASPFAGVLAGEIMDALVPRPTTTKITLFPPLEIPKLDYKPIEVELPPEPTLPPEYIPSPLPTVGYIPEWEKRLGVKAIYDVSVFYPLLREVKPSIGLQYITEILTPTYAEAIAGIAGESEIVYAGLETASATLGIKAEDMLHAPITTWQDLVSRIRSVYDVEVKPPLIIEKNLGIGVKSFAAVATVLADAVSNIKSVYNIEVLTPVAVLQRLLSVGAIQRTLTTPTWIYKDVEVAKTKTYEAVAPPAYVPSKGVGLRYDVSVETVISPFSDGFDNPDFTDIYWVAREANGRYPCKPSVCCYFATSPKYAGLYSITGSMRGALWLKLAYTNLYMRTWVHRPEDGSTGCLTKLGFADSSNPDHMYIISYYPLAKYWEIFRMDIKTGEIFGAVCTKSGIPGLYGYTGIIEVTIENTPAGVHIVFTMGGEVILDCVDTTNFITAPKYPVLGIFTDFGGAEVTECVWWDEFYIEEL